MRREGRNRASILMPTVGQRKSLVDLLLRQVLSGEVSRPGRAITIMRSACLEGNYGSELDTGDRSRLWKESA